MATTPRIPSAPELAQFFAVRDLQGAQHPTIAFTADSTAVLYSTNASGQFNLWRVPVAGGCPAQLTAYEDHTVRSVVPSPDGSVIVFSADRDGDEQYQLYAVDAAGGWPRPLTGAPEVQHQLGAGAWDRAAARLVYAANARTPAAMEVWLRDAATGDASLAFAGDGLAFPASFSPDGKALLCSEMFGNTNHRLHLVDLATGEARALTTGPAPARFRAGPWAADGSGFWVITDAGREHLGLAFLHLDTGELEWRETPDWDVTEVAGDPAGTVLVWVVNEDGWHRVYGADLRTGDPLPAADLPPGSGAVFGSKLTVSPDGRYAALQWSGPDRPFEVYVITLATGETRRLTDNMLGWLDRDRLVSPTLIRYRSTDDLDIPAWLYRPAGNPAGNGRCPVVLSIHGGPETQEFPHYQPLYQYLLSRGIGVLATNVRGSTGYGKTYQSRVHRDWGGGDLADFRHAAEWLRAQDWVDPDRLAVWGGSYGGFATLTCVTRLPEYWAAAVDICGPANLVTFARSVPPTWRSMTARWVGDPDEDADLLTERSPLTYVDQVRTPLLVIQGAQDPRVVKAESDQMVDRLRELGQTVEYVVFEDEGHGFTRRKNMHEVYKLSADWLTRHLLPAPA